MVEDEDYQGNNMVPRVPVRIGFFSSIQKPQLTTRLLHECDVASSKFQIMAYQTYDVLIIKVVNFT